MTDIEALDRLIEAVEAGEFWGGMPRPAALCTDLCWKAFHGSLDAAKALYEVLLPGWFVIITRLCEEFDSDTVTLKPADWRVDVSDGWRGWPDDEPDRHFFEADAGDPARAWLLAILKAHRAELAAKVGDA